MFMWMVVGLIMVIEYERVERSGTMMVSGFFGFFGSFREGDAFHVELIVVDVGLTLA